MLDLKNRIAVVAIINATPDSYFDGGKYTTVDTVLRRAEECIAEGADILDIGGESTGPKSPHVTPHEELERVVPLIKAIRQKNPDIWISVDTYKSVVAEEALQAGADMVNDVTAGRGDAGMFSVIAKAKCPYVMMYSKDDTPRTSINAEEYGDIIATLKEFFTDRTKRAVEAGIDPSTIMYDTGLGHFLSSDPAVSFEVLNRLGELKDFQPLFLSPSRKSFLAGPENLPASERLPATLAATELAVKNGARFIRTHDVLDTRKTVDSVTR